jgi:hypothetical protein
MDEPGPEQESAQDFARRLFGARPEPEPSGDETEAKDAEPKVEADPTQPEAKPEPSTPEERHQQFLGDLLGGAGKREVDQQLFGTGHPPAPEEDTSGSG